MASLLRISRGFARAARQVAAPVPRLGSGGAAPSDLPRSSRLSLLRGGSAVDAPPLGRAMSSHTNAPSPPASNVSRTTKKGIVKFVAEDKDLQSDEALWALYQRWCKHFDQERDHDEMVRYFPKFKETALRIDRVNKANLPYKFGFNQFSDRKLNELCFYPLGDFLDDMPCSKSQIFGSAKGILYDVDDESKDGYPRIWEQHGLN